MGQLIQSTLMKKQGMSNILKTITDSVEKQREKKAKAKQNEAVAQLVGATMSPAQKQALQEQGISIDQVAKGVDNPELLLKTVGQMQAQAQRDKQNQLAAQQLEAQQKRQAESDKLQAERVQMERERLELSKELSGLQLEEMRKKLDDMDKEHEIIDLPGYDYVLIKQPSGAVSPIPKPNINKDKPKDQQYQEGVDAIMKSHLSKEDRIKAMEALKRQIFGIRDEVQAGPGAIDAMLNVPAFNQTGWGIK